MTSTYQSGSYCRDIQCLTHIPLEKYTGDEYLRRKGENCRECHAWLFLSWLNAREWRITHSPNGHDSKDLAARLKGIRPELAEDLTAEDILCL
jgi:hypothetical protein